MGFQGSMEVSALFLFVVVEIVAEYSKVKKINKEV